MKVILLQELHGRGGEGDVIEVANGYAVNYLLPKKIAIEATAGNRKQLELRRHNIAKREAERLDTADKLLAALEGKAVQIPAKVGEEGQLFGSVTTIQIAEALAALYDITVDRKQIDLKKPIKTVGEHSAIVSIYRDIKATVRVLVVDEKAAPASDAEAVADADKAAADSTVDVDNADSPADQAESAAADAATASADLPLPTENAAAEAAELTAPTADES